MARPTKKGLEYFSHDCDAASDEKIEALRAIYGNDGYAFFFIALERIYRSEKLELDVSDAETKQIFGRKLFVNVQKLEEMIATAIKWGCFDKEAYEKRGVLTSEGIKKRAQVVTDKREKMRLLHQKRVSAAETHKETIAETTQSKVKESKVKESKENTQEAREKEYRKFADAYPQNGSTVSPNAVRNFDKLLADGVSASEIIAGAEAYAVYQKHRCGSAYPHGKYVKQADNWLNERQYAIPWRDRLKAELDLQKTAREIQEVKEFTEDNIDIPRIC